MKQEAEINEKVKMEETIAKKTYFRKEKFRLYYALGPEVEQVNSEELEGVETADKKQQFTTDFHEDVGDNNTESQCKHERIDDELSDDSGTVEDTEWTGCSIPPDIVLSASNLKIIKVEPKRSGKSKSQDMVDQDITDFRIN